MPLAGGDITYHGVSNRGTRVVNILSVGPQVEGNVTNTETLDITLSNVRFIFNN